MKALIQNSKVIQIETEAFPVHPSLEWVECDGSVAVGYLYSDGTFSPPAVIVPTLAASQDARRDQLRVDCTAAIVGLFSSSALGSPHTYDCRIEDQANIRMRQAAATIDALPRNIWAHDGVEFTREPHTTAQLDQVVIDMEAHIEADQAKLAGLIATVNAVGTGDDAADAATIAAIVW